MTLLLNQLDTKLKFTTEISNQSLPFLDILLKIENGKIVTDIYHKPTDTYNYLPFNSAHPRSTKLNIPFNLARRIRMIVTDTITRTERYEELLHILKSKGYPVNITRNAIKKAEGLNREELFNTRRTERGKIITMCHTYNPNNPNIQQIIKETLYFLNSSATMTEIMKDTEIIFAKRQCKNLKGILTRASFKSDNCNFNYKVTKCGNSCETCKLIKEGESVTFNATNEVFRVKYNFTCHSRNLIYVITCLGCKKQYIGETGTELRLRMNVHRQQTRHEELRQLFVNRHIFNCSNSQFSVFPFYKMSSNNPIERQAKETYFINRYRPELNVN